MKFIYNHNGLPIFIGLIETIKKNWLYLSEVDGAIGDGDHGINMKKGFLLFEESLKDKPLLITDGFRQLGEILLDKIGGSMGPLYGMFFISMSEECSDLDKIDKYIFYRMLNKAKDKIQSLGGANPGDKTMLDTLIPAVNAFGRALEANEDFDVALDKMKLAAEDGKESTKNMVAKVGRASRLNNRTLGLLDAGAVSCFLILHSIYDTTISLLIND